MEKKWEVLKNVLHEIVYLESIIKVLEWDQNTYLPPAGAKSRGDQLAILGRIVHAKKTSPALGQLLEEITPWAEAFGYDSDEASFVRLAKRKYEQAIRVPADFVGRFNEQIAKTHEAWLKAREEKSFEVVKPFLKEMLNLNLEKASFFPDQEHPADPFISEMDYGMKVSVIREVFRQLREQLIPLIKQISTHPKREPSILHQHYPKEKQIQFSKYISSQLGLDPKRSRLDLTMHPFMTSFAHGDIRITTRVDEYNLADCLFSVIHETGHALYEAGIHPKYDGTIFFEGASSAVHESQSRLWENIVGRSREFWEYYYPKLQDVFPNQLGNVTLDQFYQAINHVETSLIRTEADEVTYNLHVMIRFELELALLEGRLTIDELPEAWRARYQLDLGVVPSDDVEGVLQDIHWYVAGFGGLFQGYTLGNILSAQFYEAACRAHPEIPEQLRQGNVTVLHQWLKEQIYQYGCKYTTEEIVKRAVGTSLEIGPYMRYLKGKYKKLYHLD